MEHVPYISNARKRVNDEEFTREKTMFRRS